MPFNSETAKSASKKYFDDRAIKQEKIDNTCENMRRLKKQYSHQYEYDDSDDILRQSSKLMHINDKIQSDFKHVVVSYLDIMKSQIAKNNIQNEDNHSHEKYHNRHMLLSDNSESESPQKQKTKASCGRNRSEINKNLFQNDKLLIYTRKKSLFHKTKSNEDIADISDIHACKPWRISNGTRHSKHRRKEYNEKIQNAYHKLQKDCIVNPEGKIVDMICLD